VLARDATPGKLIICTCDVMGIVGSIGKGRFKSEIDAVVEGEKEMSVVRV
jgi:hypothetical protein